MRIGRSVSTAIATHAALTDTHGVTTKIADTDELDTHEVLTLTHGVTTKIADTDELDTHEVLKTGVHSVGEAYLTKTSQSDQSLSDTEIPAAIARDAEAILQSLIDTRGDIIFRGASVAEKLAKGADGEFLKMGANDPEWVASTALVSKVIAATRDLAAATGDVSHTGVGFAPTAIICLSAVSDTVRGSIGIVDSSLVEKQFETSYRGTTDNYTLGDQFFSIMIGGSDFCRAVVKSMDADGFTETITKTGSPTGTLLLSYLCLK